MKRQIKAVLGFITTLILLQAYSVNAGQAQAAYSVISHTSLKAMVEADIRNFLLIDARNPEEYQEAHIPGAINIIQNKFEDFIGLLPADRATQIIYYCNGVKCGKSKKAAEKTMALGYTNVWVYAEGMPVWEELGYSFYKGGEYEKRIETTKLSPAELNKIMIESPETITVVDVRDPEEFSQGHIPGALNLPLKTLATSSGVLDKKKKIVVYCNSGGRSYGAYRKLIKLGYKDIGQAIFADWQKAGFQGGS